MALHFCDAWNFRSFLPLMFLSSLLLPSNWRWRGLGKGGGGGVEISTAWSTRCVTLHSPPHLSSPSLWKPSKQATLYKPVNINFQFHGLWFLSGENSFTRLANFHVFWLRFCSFRFNIRNTIVYYFVEFHSIRWTPKTKMQHNKIKKKNLFDDSIKRSLTYFELHPSNMK